MVCFNLEIITLFKDLAYSKDLIFLDKTHTGNLQLCLLHREKIN
jgi:hypothetical protein